MDEAVTSRAACCCRFGALDNFGAADSSIRWAAAHSPQKIQEIRFRDVLARAARICHRAAGTRHLFQLHIVFSGLDRATFGSWQVFEVKSLKSSF
jgi:hypothetical protein